MIEGLMPAAIKSKVLSSRYLSPLKYFNLHSFVCSFVHKAEFSINVLFKIQQPAMQEEAEGKSKSPSEQINFFSSPPPPPPSSSFPSTWRQYLLNLFLVLLPPSYHSGTLVPGGLSHPPTRWRLDSPPNSQDLSQLSQHQQKQKRRKEKKGKIACSIESLSFSLRRPKLYWLFQANFFKWIHKITPWIVSSSRGRKK